MGDTEPSQQPGTSNYVGYVCAHRKLSFPTGLTHTILKASMVNLLVEFITTWPIRKQVQRGGSTHPGSHSKMSS